MQLRADSEGTVRVPVEVSGSVRLFAVGPTPGSRGEEIGCTVDDYQLSFDAAAGGGRWLYLIKDS